jgi:MOSC domain-containing protein YiiM
VLSVNVGTPRRVQGPNGAVLTSIFKSPVQGKVALRGVNLEGDRQSDRTAHGGPNKAVYLYPSEHYSYWAEQLPGTLLPFGAFGENLTTEGLLEESVHIGDQFRMGSAILQVAQPRMPCYKLALRLNRPDMVKRFWRSGFSGIYFAVVQEGEIEQGDEIEQVGVDPVRLTVADVVRLYRDEITDAELFERALQAPLRGCWKEEVRAKWAEMGSRVDARAGQMTTPKGR